MSHEDTKNTKQARRKTKMTNALSIQAFLRVLFVSFVSSWLNPDKTTMPLNTTAAVRDEGNWRYDGWSPRIPSESAFDTFVGTILARASDYLRFRVGVTWYASNVAVDPWDDLLKEAEMHLAQAYLLEAAAQIAESGDDNNPAPFLGSGEQLRDLGRERRARAEEIIAGARQVARPGPRGPYFGTALGADAVLERFESDAASD